MVTKSLSGPEDGAVESVARGEQGRGGGRQSDAVALQLLEGVATRGQLGQRFLGAAAVRAMHRLLLACFGDEVAGVLRGRGCPLGLVSQEARPLDGVVAPALGGRQLALKMPAMRRGAGGPLAERRELAFERGALALERAQGLRVRLQRLLPLADLCALLAEAPAHVLLGVGPTAELGADALVLAARGLVVARGRVPLHERVLRPELHLPTLFLRPLSTRRCVGQSLGRQGEVPVELAELEPHRPQPAGDLGASGLRGGAAPRGRLAVLLAVVQPLARRRQQLGELGEAGLHPRGLVAQSVEEAPRQASPGRRTFPRRA